MTMNHASQQTSRPLAREGQDLLDHIVGTASLARVFAEPFGLGYLAYVCGLLHDLGKYSAAFQCYLAKALSGKPTSRGEVPHAWEGALAILRQLGEDRKTMGLADIMANIVASHHGGLTDMIVDSERFMPARIETHVASHPEQFHDVIVAEEAADLLAKIDWDVVMKEFAELRTKLAKPNSKGSPAVDRFALHLATKLIYSCLVDADRCNAAGLDLAKDATDWNAMEDCLDARLAKFEQDGEVEKSPLDHVRADISMQCANQAVRAPGVFTLSVPTGGGKTLSSLRFAIRHARANGLKRIVYVIPYLSIIDQTARDFREIFGNRADGWLLEHHSNFLLESDSEDDEKRYDLGTQRWDAPIIVTTMVQFLESVMSNRASDLRKFHNMMQSVFVFDEVQALPVKCTHLFNGTINFLHGFGGSSCVMCSATQPALAKVERPLQFSPSPDLVALSEADKNLFRRTELIDMTSPELTCEEIADLALSRLRQGKSTLVVLNTKAEARKVFHGLGDANTKFFLSTDMCPAHRLNVIDRMRTLLSSDDDDGTRPIICVSTQLIEAGVDISFDCVIRAEAGFDSVIQAAGRCNRHGRSSTPQEVFVVRVKDEKLGNLDEIAQGKELTARILREGIPDDETAILSKYYSYKFGLPQQKALRDYPVGKDATTVYGWLYEWLEANLRAKTAYADAHGGQFYLGLHSAFQSAAEHFAVIPGIHIGVVVPYGKPGAPHEVQSLVSDFRATGERLRTTFGREARADIYRERSRILRRLQQYTISVFPNKEAAIRQIASQIDDTFYLLSPHHYDPVIGLDDEQGFLNA